MLRQVFVDTSAWVAIADSKEARHEEAVKIYTDLLRDGSLLVTTILVFRTAIGFLMPSLALYQHRIGCMLLR